MIEFENIREVKGMIRTAKENKIQGLSVFSSFIRMIIFLILYAVLMAGVALFVYNYLNRPSRLVRVPSVVSKNFLDAYLLLKKNGFDVHVVIQNYPDVPYGTVMEQSINPDSIVKERRKIVLTVAGKETVSFRTTTNAAATPELRSVYVKWKFPSEGLLEPGEIEADVSIFITDEGRYNDTLIFNQRVRPGTTISIPLQVIGKVKYKIMVNGALIVEKEIP